MTRTTKIADKIREDLAHYALREHTGVSAAFAARMFLLTPGFQFVLALRIQEALFRIPLVGRLLRRIAWWASCLLFGSEIAMAASVDGGLYVPHPYGIVVGACDIGKRVTLLQHITIGRRDHTDRGRPRIDDGASLMAGCVVLGDITIGSGATIGANSVVLKDVPPDCVAIGAPAKILRRADAPIDAKDELQDAKSQVA
ncbi:MULTISPECIES: serine O-acetyltransferase EpsC [Bradyrhizobium]|uniref:serine O-acetyltransferase EpsC n=1 Tax=Bradyrhizobium TaxID=374 RepID=UPI00263B3B65|nr:MULTISPECIES: serine O-acetyltransferase EpsC [Bradyrhizobium]